MKFWPNGHSITSSSVCLIHYRHQAERSPRPSCPVFNRCIKTTQWSR